MTPPLFGVVGWKNSGKTTLMTRLIGELTRRGYAISVIKHAHEKFEIDQPGAGQRVESVRDSRFLILHIQLRGSDGLRFHHQHSQVFTFLDALGGYGGEHIANKMYFLS